MAFAKLATKNNNYGKMQCRWCNVPHLQLHQLILE